MAELKVDIPDDMERKMKAFPRVNWSEKAGQAISEELKRRMLLKLADETFKHSKLSEDDVLRLGKESKKSMHAEFKKEHPEAYEG